MYSVSCEPRTTCSLPADAVLHARAGMNALRGNMPDQARVELLTALRLHPYLWEAFEGLCALGIYSLLYLLVGIGLRLRVLG